jgi:UDP-3-O-[3-hydroxymyristoyl] glucosamine N-acyltransferase
MAVGGDGAVRIPLSELAARIGGELVGGDGVDIAGVAGIDEAGDDEITYVAKPSLLARAEQGRAAAVIVPREVTVARKPIVRADNPRLAFAKALALFAPPTWAPKGVHPTALVGERFRTGEGVSIGPYCVVGDDVHLGDGVVLHAQAIVGDGCELGTATVVYPRVVLYPRVRLGERVTIHAGSVLGSDGFGYVPTDAGLHKMPQIGTVIVGDDVEIGANVTIDRATTDATMIGRGTKIDNLVHIAHNVIIGEDCIIVGQVGISGTVNIGDGVVLAGQAGVADHITVGAGARVCAQAGVVTDIPSGATVSGFPAMTHRERMRIEASARKLPRILRRIKAIERRLGIDEGDGET